MSETQFTRIAPNPFQAGAPVSRPEMFFGREDDFNYVHQRLEAEEEGIVLMLVGARRSGKTSIMFQILNGRLGPNYLPIFIDMQLLAGVSNDREFFGRMAEIICDAVQDERLVASYYDFAEGSPILIFDRLMEDVQQANPGRRLILLIDEAEILQSKIQKGELTGAVLIYMASLLEQRNVSFCLTGSVALNEVDSEEWRRLAGKGTSREISFLSPEDTRRLVESPVEGRVHYETGVVDTIYQLTYGYAFYTQLICSYAVDHLNHAERNSLTDADLEEVVQTLVDNPPPQLVYQWDDLSESDQYTLAIVGELCDGAEDTVSAENLRQAIRDNKYPVDLRTEALRVSLESLCRSKWLERSEAGEYRFRVDLFRRWLRRARPIWSLVEESGEIMRRRPRFVWIGGIAATVAVVAALLLYMRSRDDDERALQEIIALAQPRSGQIWVDAQPRDAELWVDGQRQTRTLPTMLDGKPGGHIIELRHARYHAYRETLMVEAGGKDTLHTELRRLMGGLSVRTQPTGAHIRLKGERDTSLAAPFAELKLPTGPYLLRAEQRGFVAVEQKIEITAGQTQALDIALQDNVGHLYLTTSPAGATVTLDGKTLNTRTPIPLTNLPVGRHRLQVALADYLLREQTVQIRLAHAETLSLTLNIKPVHLLIDSTPPGAQVLLGDSVWAHTPVDLQAEPGEYVLRIVHEGYREETIAVKLAPGQEYSRRFDLVRYQGQLRIHGYFGEVDIVDKESGQLLRTVRSPTDVSLPVGNYLLKNGKNETAVEVTREEKKVIKLK